MAGEIQHLDYEGLAYFKELLNGVDIATATGNGAAYTVTIPGLTALKKGLLITIIPNATSTTTIPTLNVNGLGAKNIKQRLSINTSLTAGAANESWMVANKPLPLLFDGTQWVTITGRASANDIYGVLTIGNGGTGAETAEEARANLGAASRVYLTAKLGTTWIGDSAPYTQSLTVAGILESDKPHISPIYSEALETALEEKEAWSMVSKAETSDGAITFTCFEDKPSVEIAIQIEVIR